MKMNKFSQETKLMKKKQNYLGPYLLISVEKTYIKYTTQVFLPFLNGLIDSWFNNGTKPSWPELIPNDFYK